MVNLAGETGTCGLRVRSARTVSGKREGEREHRHRDGSHRFSRVDTNQKSPKRAQMIGDAQRLAVSHIRSLNSR